MTKKYHIVECLEGNHRLWAKAITYKSALKVLESLKARFPFRTFKIEVK